jgi:hypothetical protein
MKKIGYILTLILFAQFSCKTTKVAVNKTTETKIQSIKEIISKPEKPIIKALKSNRDSVFAVKYDTYQIFSKNGKLIENRRCENDGSLYQKRVNAINEKGVLINGKKYNSEGKIIETWKYLYDDNGNMIEVTYYDNDGIFTGKQVNKYDKNNNLTEYYYQNSKGKVTNRDTYKYFKNGKIKEQHRYKSDGTLRDRRTYEYDDNGNEIIDKAYKADGSIMIYKSEYDKMNNIIENYWINEKGEQTHQTSFEYVYDNNENWITKKRSSNGELGMIWERKIEYY